MKNSPKLLLALLMTCACSAGFSQVTELTHADYYVECRYADGGYWKAYIGNDDALGRRMVDYCRAENGSAYWGF